MTVSITPLELDFLWATRQVGEPPYPLEIPSHGATMDERAALRQRVHEALRDRGMLDPTGRLDARLDDWLGVLAVPRLSIDLVFLPEPAAGPVRALAAAGPGVAVLAVQDADALTLRQLDPSRLVSAVVDLLPPAARGTQRSISLPTEESGDAPSPAGRASEAEARRELARLTGLPSRRGGQIGVTSRDPLGGRRRSAVLAWFDNETGRYLSRITTARDGRRWTTVAPADAATLRARVSEMIDSVTDDGR